MQDAHVHDPLWSELVHSDKTRAPKLLFTIAPKTVGEEEYGGPCLMNIGRVGKGRGRGNFGTLVCGFRCSHFDART